MAEINLAETEDLQNSVTNNNEVLESFDNGSKNNQTSNEASRINREIQKLLDDVNDGEHEPKKKVKASRVSKQGSLSMGVGKPESKKVSEEKTLETKATRSNGKSKRISSFMTENEILDKSIEQMELPDLKNASRFVALQPVSNNGQYDIPHHPLLKSYPESNDLEKLALSNDFKENGIRQPVYTFKGKLIDGRFRVEKAEELGLEFQIVEYQGDESELQSFMDSLHVLKKDYTPTQRAILAFENKDRFKKQNNPSAKKKELEGAKPKKRHDSNELANTYYNASAGNVAKVKKLDGVAKGSLLYDYTKSGKLNIDVALYLANINILNDEELLNLVYQHKLNSKQSRDLSFIKKDENLVDLYQRISTESDSREVKRLIRYYAFRQYDDILSDLMSRSIDIKEAQARKELLLNSSAIYVEDSDNSKDLVDLDNARPIIDIAIFNRISVLANKSKLSVNQFLSNLIEGYELSQQGGSNEAA